MTIGDMRPWREHPVRSAALAGGVFGLLYAMVLELREPFLPGGGGVLNMLLPGPHGGGVSHTGIMRVALLLGIEVGANVVVWALLFAVPVGVVVLIRRALGMGRKRR
jgi:hypothetical protein